MSGRQVLCYGACPSPVWVFSLLEFFFSFDPFSDSVFGCAEFVEKTAGKFPHLLPWFCYVASLFDSCIPSLPSIFTFMD